MFAALSLFNVEALRILAITSVLVILYCSAQPLRLEDTEILTWSLSNG